MLEKPARGTATRDHRLRQARAEAAEADAKRRAALRDGYRCRYPWCGATVNLHGAHLTHKGMGGDVRLLRTSTATLVTLCKYHHDGLDGRLGWGRKFYIDPQSEYGADGLLAFRYVNGGHPFAVEVEIGKSVAA